jgi:CRISPR-associated protein Cmr6
MLLPLYDVLQQKKPQKSLDSNAGLWFERFFDRYGYNKKDGKFEVTGDQKNSWLQNINHAGNTDALQLAAKQQLSLVNALNGKCKFFNTQWHFVTGTGYPHPVENGLLWHKTYGVPYLSGAAVKGLVRAWVEEWQEFDSEEARKHCLFSWFGSDDKIPEKQSQASQAGDIIFFDAFPVQAVQLKTDIMTPHYGDWYSEGGKIKNVANQPEKIPADWHNPEPHPFLVVDNKTPFLFSVALRPRSDLIKNKTEDEIKAESKKVMVCLTEALKWLGAGAKTATGYGQIPFDQKVHHDIEKELRRAWDKKAEEHRKIEEQRLFEEQLKDLTSLEQQTYFKQIRDENWQDDKNAFWQAGRVEKWLDELETKPDLKIINSLKALINKHFEGLLANPEKVQGKKAKPVYNERQQKIAKRMNKL